MFTWLKKNKLTALLIAVVAYLLFARSSSPTPLLQKTSFSSLSDAYVRNAGGNSLESVDYAVAPSYEESAVPSTSSERLVIQNSYLSLVVKEVRQTVDQMIAYAQDKGGFMVSSSFSHPEEAPYATVSLRVPAKELDAVLAHFRELAIKVSSENLVGQDVTDQHEDLEAKLATLSKTKAKFEEILEKAEKVQDILAVQRELVSLQGQIDALKGRQEYLEKSASLALVTAHLSTDEYALPYTPAQPFRPAVIFKQAVRSLVSFFRSVAVVIIWAIVFLPVWLPALLFARWWKKKYSPKV